MISIYGRHCDTCGSLVEACGDEEQCKRDAALHIEAAILSNEVAAHPALRAAQKLLARDFEGEKTE